MDIDGTTTLVSVGTPGSSLVVTVQRQATGDTGEPWFDTEIAVAAAPFAGIIRTLFTLTDLQQWVTALTSLRQGMGRAVLGGDRAAELAIEASAQVGGAGDSVALSIEVTPSGDDPYPMLHYLIFDVPRAWTEVALRGGFGDLHV